VNWKPHIITAVLAFLVGGAAVWFVGNMGQKPDDPALLAQIADLEDEVEGEQHAAATAHADANEQRKLRGLTEGQLKRTQLWLRQARKAKNVTCVEERDVLREQNNILVQHNHSLDSETIDLRRSITHLNRALDASLTRSALMGKRYTALKRAKKSEKRKRVIQQVFTHTGVFVVAWAGGKYSQ
jgi:hypothetical protein